MYSSKAMSHPATLLDPDVLIHPRLLLLRLLLLLLLET
jgi:hypothetical protein